MSTGNLLLIKLTTSIDIARLIEQGINAKQNLDSDLLARAEKLVSVAEARHDNFRKQHEKDCQGEFCPNMGGNMVQANTDN